MFGFDRGFSVLLKHRANAYVFLKPLYNILMSTLLPPRLIIIAKGAQMQDVGRYPRTHLEDHIIRLCSLPADKLPMTEYRISQLSSTFYLSYLEAANFTQNEMLCACGV